MPVLQLDDQQFPLGAGTTRIGAGGGTDVSLPGDPMLGVQAFIDRADAGSMTIRRATPAAQVRVNGVLLGAEPTPLMHGDRLEVGGVQLRFADDAKAGATQFVTASEMAALAGAKRTGAPRATAASGGRLVSLVDGKEYTVVSSGLLLGRDASCDVVVAQDEVSRRHAQIAPGDQGYVVRDTSANGVFVNGERVQGSRRLARSDVLRVGTEEFRFYADVLPAGPTPVASLPAAPPSKTPSAEPAHAALMSFPTPMASPREEAPRPELATLEILNEGPAKGTRFPIHGTLTHVGRGTHNDVRLADDSVSETHAKLQRREDGWYVVDLDSTNGTYVGGTRIVGERRLGGAPDVRFGGMKLRFTAAGSGGEGESKGTRAIASVERLRRTVPVSAPAQPAPAPVERGISVWVWVIGALAAATAFFVLKGRA